jgi:SAM-dependent methyltransferase
VAAENETPRKSSSGRERCWYERSFGADYLDLYRHRDLEEARQGAALAVRVFGLDSTAAILDLCCGAGRHQEALSEFGLRAVGLDLSPVLLAAARRRQPGARIVRGDMRRLPFRDGTFDATLSFFTSFGYFANDDENQAVLAEVNRVLRAGGRFLLDFLNRDHVLAHGLHDTREVRERWVVDQRRRWNRETDTIDKRITLRPLSHGDEPRVYTESVKLYSPDRIAAFFENHGFSIGSTFGSLQGEPFVSSSSRFIITGKKTP